MKRLFFSFSFLMFVFSLSAQDSPSAIKEKDSVIMLSVVVPALTSSLRENAIPDWQKLSENIKSKYDDYYAERMVTKGKIYYYYGRSWTEFSKALVLFTEKYEDKDDLALMDKNANFVLKNSTDKDEIKAALKWSGHTVEKDPSNKNYKSTYEQLQEKLKQL